MNTVVFAIREIEPGDDPELGAVIREVLPGTGAPTEGTAFADPSLDAMYETYRAPRSRYWVIEGQGRVWGGGGIAPLDGGDPDTCELQKMYFKREVRGKGLGKAILEKALQAARELGYRTCYLETMPYMEAALSLYQRHGFEALQGPMGCTGHTACQVWMIKKLQ